MAETTSDTADPTQSLMSALRNPLALAFIGGAIVVIALVMVF